MCFQGTGFKEMPLVERDWGAVRVRVYVRAGVSMMEMKICTCISLVQQHSIYPLSPNKLHKWGLHC